MNAPVEHPVSIDSRLSRLAARVAAKSPLVERLSAECRGDVLFDIASRGRYATDASIYQIFPIGVVVPCDEADARTALSIARELAVPVLPRGAGSSQCGQTVGEALVIDHSKSLRAVIDFDPGAMTVSVQPGVVLDQLNAFLRPHGLWFPVDVSTSAQATIGGMAGNNSCGSRSIEYGNMVHNVIGIDAILADGREIAFGPAKEMHDAASSTLTKALFAIGTRERDEIGRMVPHMLRRVGGYNVDVFNPQSVRPYTPDGSVNFAHLLVGSEGTLAYFSRLKLQLARLPASKALGVVNFPSFRAAMASAQHIVALKPTAVELVDRTMIELARANPAFRPVIERALIGEPEAVLLVEFAGEEESAQSERVERLSELMADLGLPNAVVGITAPGAQKELWDVRKAGLNIMMSMKGDGKPVSFIEDCAVPLEHLEEYTERLTQVFRKHGTDGTWYAHASVGTLHVRPILDMRRGGAAKMRAIAEEAAAIVRQYKGAYSGEHGDGLCRSEWVAWQFGPRLNAAFAEIKALFDPGNRMNPGKIVAPPRMDDATLFRFGPHYRRRPFEPALDWSPWDVQRDPLTGQETGPGTGGDPAHGLASAIEMCNNNGHCRKFDAGTMCPSFRVTRDEQHTTRGRANTLRLALAGQLGQEDFAGDAVRDALDLCVSCKGCRRECPTGVDMAKLKIEVLAARNARCGVSLRQRFVAYLPRYAPTLSRLPWVANLRDRIPGAARLSERWLGLSQRRSLPQWQAPFPRTAKSGSPASATPEPDREVVLFIDTFSRYFAHSNARAATRVLEAGGYTVHTHIPASGRPLCCGRTFLSSGMVEQAREEARRTLDALLPYVRRGVSIVGLEPSCLLTLRDEFLTYRFGGDAQLLAKNALLFEEFLVREKAAGRLSLKLKSLPNAETLLHGHCHQKAFAAFEAVTTVLDWIPELKTRVVESSCCGMAGTFGYEVEHYDVSMKMAELTLLPAIRATAPETLIVANGFSCRHQIADGTGRDAMHVAQVLDLALDGVQQSPRGSER
ncbi:MAG TPA: FAD-linked oxidase C-terminal domain-containing protein [Casimicrobiaceae bacterium]|jgi:FAD/FMN-containing dehydrogenase/Fe-S oxidoreductase|nr:FAD-linked oxidase C-terminal domain-containing protein [Casimicrobiaceae bacterium]